MEKQCFKCGETKEIDDFYAHAAMGDGHLGKCKSCTKRDVRRNRLKNIHAVRTYDRRRANLPHRVALRRHISDEWQRRFPNRSRAQAAAKRAYRKGVLVKPHACEGCGREVRLERHHPDYDKPLLVVWLCKPCHAIADTIRRRCEEYRPS